jgi:hypothetical protein
MSKRLRVIRLGVGTDCKEATYHSMQNFTVGMDVQHIIEYESLDVGTDGKKAA